MTQTLRTAALSALLFLWGVKCQALIFLYKILSVPQKTLFNDKMNAAFCTLKHRHLTFYHAQKSTGMEFKSALCFSWTEESHFVDKINFLNERRSFCLQVAQPNKIICMEINQYETIKVHHFT